MNQQEYLALMKKIQTSILKFIENEDNLEENYENLIKIINDGKIAESRCLLNDLLHLLSKIAENHIRSSNLIEKITKILNYFKSSIQQQLTSGTILKIFKLNKKIILFLFEEKFIEVDDITYKIIRNTNGYFMYFYPEIKELFQKEIDESPDKESSVCASKIKAIFDEKLPDFYDKRKKGENDSQICEYIQKDLIDEFITYVNKNEISLNSKINSSMYETNAFLLSKKNVSLIEYAAFFGSIQIFKYLQKNDAELTPLIWLYAIHGDNPEIIDILVEKKILPKDQTYKDCYIEAIKCHHNDMVQWIENNLFKEKSIDSFYILKYLNFNYINKNMVNDKSIFRYLCQYDYASLVDIFLKNLSVDINENIVLYIILF